VKATQNALERTYMFNPDGCFVYTGTYEKGVTRVEIYGYTEVEGEGFDLRLVLKPSYSDEDSRRRLTTKRVLDGGYNPVARFTG